MVNAVVVVPTKLCDTQGKPGLAVGCLSTGPTTKTSVQPSESMLLFA